MAATNRTKVMSSGLVKPSSPSLNQNSKSPSNHLKRNRTCSLKTSSACLCSFFGGLAVSILFVISIVVPLVITLKTIGTSTSSTNVTTVTTTTPITVTTTTITIISTTSATTITTTSDTSTTSATSSTASATSISTNIMSTSTLITTSLLGSTTTFAPFCNASHVANQFNKTATAGWTQLSFNYTALSTGPTLVFGFSANSFSTIYLDDVSVVDTNPASVQLLNNPSFENATANVTSWITWSATTACTTGGAYPGKITNASCHSGNCYVDKCRSPSYDYLVQSFPATIGNIYTVAFWYQITGFGSSGFDVNVEG